MARVKQGSTVVVVVACRGNVGGEGGTYDSDGNAIH